MQTTPRRRSVMWLFWLAAAYPAWLLLQAAHEAGHVLHAVASGGRVEHVELPLLGFSRTDVSPNPHPLFVAWGGVVWGSLLPVIGWLVARRHARLVRTLTGALAGFCLVGNGAYLAVGWVDRVGDAGDLIRHGTPTWVLMVAGSAAVAAGLWVGHRLGGGPEPRRPHG